MNMPYQVIRSDRKTIAIQLKPDGEIVVRCPRGMRTEDVRCFVERKADWIQTQRSKLPAQGTVKYTNREIEQFRAMARGMITSQVKYYAPIIGVSYNQIAIRKQRTRWGSCSSKGNLNFNCLLALVPPEVLDYVVVHELCHRKEMNHSARFWSEVKRILPDYVERREWLKMNGPKLIVKI